MINADELLKLPRLGKDETFIFGCNQCGKCCREREDILLTPLDLFKIAKYLKKSIPDILNECCETYEGAASKIPIVRIKPREYRRTCPLSDKGRCLVHPVKPAVCALFPLGRMTDVRTNEFVYFLQSVSCGNKRQIQTVRQWLDGFSILEEENFTIMWHQKIGEISAILREVYNKIEFNHDRINGALLLNFYILYDLDKDFMKQFLINCKEALRITKKINEQISDGYG